MSQPKIKVVSDCGLTMELLFRYNSMRSSCAFVVVSIQVVGVIRFKF